MKSDFHSIRNRFENLSVNSSDTGHGAQRPIRALRTEHGPPKANTIPHKSEKETLSPGLERTYIVPERETKMAHYESLKVFQMPLCLIETGPDGKSNICQDVLAQIREIDIPLNIVCIAGPYRTGKSYLLTRLAGFNKGFPLGNTIESKTKGIWVWCRPHPVNRDQVLLLLDTEGLGDIKKGDPNHDNQILVLGILLSSTLVYNIPGKFSSEDLDKLSFVTKLSKSIQFADNMSVDHSRSNFDRTFPTFILALRDFTLELIYEGKQITSDEYLELVCLNLEKETSPKDQARNSVRLCLREYFKTRKCFTFDRPGGRDILPSLEKLQDKDLDKFFIQESKRFTEYVHNICPPKQVDDGHPINGRKFVMLAQTYVDAIRNGNVPNVENALTTMARLENTHAVEESVKIYQSGMDKLEYPTLDISTLRAAHERCFNDALDFFMGNSMNDEEHNYYNLAISQITKEHENFRTRDQEESEKKSQETLDRMDAVIKQNVENRVYHCRGGKKDIFDQYLTRTASQGHLIMQVDDTLTTNDKEIEAEREKVAEAERKLRAEVSLREEQQREQREHKETMLLRKEDMKKQKQKDKYEMEKRMDHMQKVLEQRIEEQKRLERELFRNEAERARQDAEQLRKELDECKNVGFFRRAWRAIY